ncbi:hypothetical protein KIN20_016977 [Parelaphostrongylus tenuis]|uniref:Uncharacterized protein n=1 Tax=Parelaphostrongylus tenuis TaxID=148309 RepID=A0AAD5MMJ8_PARTN|nr:hypothetical protein KIN20_016977 [Parelaphostrongylus tenuis]
MDDVTSAGREVEIDGGNADEAAVAHHQPIIFDKSESGSIEDLGRSPREYLMSIALLSHSRPQLSFGWPISKSCHRCKIEMRSEIN